MQSLSQRDRIHFGQERDRIRDLLTARIEERKGLALIGKVEELGPLSVDETVLFAPLAVQQGKHALEEGKLYTYQRLRRYLIRLRKDHQDKIMQLYNNSNLCSEMGERGKRAVLAKYNIDVSGENLVKMYNNINN